MTSITEKRWRECSGQQYMSDGLTVRCQAVAKGQVQRWREEHDDRLTPTEELWPECQCTRAAEPGAYVCRWHGGYSPGANQARSIYDVVPLDLGNKLKTLLEDPYYMSRREDIALLRARQWELLEALSENMGGLEAWGTVDDALYELERGKEQEAAQLLREALRQTKETQRSWDEIYKVSNVLKDMTSTEVKTVKEMRSMATAEQVGRLMERILNILTYGAEKYIEDKRQQSSFLQYIAREFVGATNLRALATGEQLEPGSGEEE